MKFDQARLEDLSKRFQVKGGISRAEYGELFQLQELKIKTLTETIEKQDKRLHEMLSALDLDKKFEELKEWIQKLHDEPIIKIRNKVIEKEVPIFVEERPFVRYGKEESRYFNVETGKMIKGLEVKSDERTEREMGNVG